MINNDNYFSQENSLKYVSTSQFKDFMKCEDMALARISGDYKSEKSTALLVGSYVDSYFEGTLEEFKSNNPEIFTQKGMLKSEYKQAENIISRIEKDKHFMDYMSGEKQVIMTGEIENVPVKIKMDFYHSAKVIVDLKIIKDFNSLYVSGKGRLNFIEAWGYDIQGAIYQEIVSQNTGAILPFVIAAATKEKITDIETFYIPQYHLDNVLGYVKSNILHINDLKQGNIEPKRCGKCDWCKSTKVLTEVKNMEVLDFES